MFKKILPIDDSETWTKKEETVLFSNNTLESAIRYNRGDEEIFIGVAGQTRIIFITDPARGAAVVEKCFQQRIPVDDLLGGRLGTVGLYSGNRDYFSAFLDVIDTVSSVRKIKNEIVGLFPHTQRLADTSVWYKVGDFSKEYATGGDLYKYVTYKNLNKLKSHEEIFIGAYRDDSMQIIFKSDDKVLIKSLAVRCNEKGLYPVLNQFTGNLYFANDKGDERIYLSVFIDTISEFSPIEDFIKIEMAQTFSVVRPARALFSPVVLPESLSIFNNHLVESSAEENCEKEISDEEMSKSAFGQGSNTAKKLLRK